MIQEATVSISLPLTGRSTGMGYRTDQEGYQILMDGVEPRLQETKYAREPDSPVVCIIGNPHRSFTRES